ncbi:MAG: stage II sporulation protein P [Sarcina sp.]
MIQKSIRRKQDFPIGGFLFLCVSVIFMARFVNIALQSDLGGTHAYVQILNLGMPLVEGTYYDERAYEESNVTISGLIKETLGINNIDPTTILAMEIPRFNKFNEIELVKNDIPIENQNEIDSFVLDDESVKKQEKLIIGEDDPLGIRNPNIVKRLDQTNPQVLMYNAHTTEAIGQGRRLIEDKSKNIQGVTELIEKELEEYYGIAVIFDKTKHDTFYEQSYDRAKETLYKYKEQYGEGRFNLVIDVHRDGVVPENGEVTERLKQAVTTEMNGESVSRLMFVETSNSGPENYATTTAINQRMFDKCNEIFPGLARYIRKGQRGYKKYNQEVFKNSTLIEIGAEINTPAESKAAAKYVARLIAEEIHYQENN